MAKHLPGDHAHDNDQLDHGGNALREKLR